MVFKYACSVVCRCKSKQEQSKSMGMSVRMLSGSRLQLKPEPVVWCCCWFVLLRLAHRGDIEMVPVKRQFGWVWIGLTLKQFFRGYDAVGRTCRCTRLLGTLRENKSLAGGGHVPITCCLSELSWNRPAPITMSFFSWYSKERKCEGEGWWCPRGFP